MSIHTYESQSGGVDSPEDLVSVSVGETFIESYMASLIREFLENDLVLSDEADQLRFKRVDLYEKVNVICNMWASTPKERPDLREKSVIIRSLSVIRWLEDSTLSAAAYEPRGYWIHMTEGPTDDYWPLVDKATYSNLELYFSERNGAKTKFPEFLDLEQLVEANYRSRTNFNSQSLGLLNNHLVSRDATFCPDGTVNYVSYTISPPVHRTRILPIVPVSTVDQA